MVRMEWRLMEETIKKLTQFFEKNKQIIRLFAEMIVDFRLINLKISIPTTKLDAFGVCVIASHEIFNSV
jgi:hypothetical protein